MKKNFIMSGAEPFYYPGGRTGILLIHGFTGTPHEMLLAGQAMQARGYTTLGIRLSGHGTTMADLERVRWHDWLTDIESGLAILKASSDVQVLAGLSMGAALSLIAASRYPVRGVIAISAPGYYEPAWHKPILPVAGLFARTARKGKPDWHDEQQRREHVTYPYYPLRAVPQYIKVLEALHAALPEIRVPALLVQSSKDNVVPRDSLDYLRQRMTGVEAETLWVHESNHMVTLEPDREAVFAAMADFIGRVSGG